MNFNEKHIKNRRKRKLWYRAVSLMAAVTVFVTTYALILPAVALTRKEK